MASVVAGRGGGVVLCGLWALTLAAPDEPVRVVAPPQTAPPPRVEAAVAAPELLPCSGAGRRRRPPKPICRPACRASNGRRSRPRSAQRPDAPAELQRLRAYLEWSDALRRFREARARRRPGRGAGGAGAELEQGLGERIRRAEVSAAEARQIESAILALTVADEAERSERLRQWAAAELAPAAAADPRQAAFERRQVEIVAAWSALPPAARDRAALERELEVLRQQSFAAGTGPR